MKTRFIKVTFVAAIAMIGAVNVFNANKTETLSDIALANVEALAEDEEEEMGTKYSNASGTKYCCCPGGSRTCGAKQCANC